MFTAKTIYTFVWKLIHSFDKYLLSTNYMLVIYVSTGDVQ